jgi:hypothetical protein
VAAAFQSVDEAGDGTRAQAGEVGERSGGERSAAGDDAQGPLVGGAQAEAVADRLVEQDHGRAQFRAKSRGGPGRHAPRGAGRRPTLRSAHGTRPSFGSPNILVN